MSLTNMEIRFGVPASDRLKDLGPMSLPVKNKDAGKIWDKTHFPTSFHSSSGITLFCIC